MAKAYATDVSVGESVVRRRRLVPALRALVSLAMLAFLLQRVQRVKLSSILPAWRPHSGVWIGAALLVTFFGVVLSAMRWSRVLAALEIPARLRTLVSHYLAGLFVGNFLPSTIGGDVLRVSRLSASNGEAPRTFASVVLERLTGWLVLPLISLMGLFGNPTLLRLGTASHVALALSFGTLALLTAILVLAGSPALGGRFSTNEGWLRFAGAVHLGIDRFRHAPMAAVEVFATALAYQLAVMFAAFLAVQAMGLHVGWTAILAFMPAVAIAQVLPITIGGLGLREGAIVLFLTPLGVGTAEAIALGLLIYGINLTVSLLGAPAFAVGNGSNPTARAVA
jgi:uncharacterized membrane protein YbhN (UPF0104 family)